MHSHDLLDFVIIIIPCLYVVIQHFCGLKDNFVFLYSGTFQIWHLEVPKAPTSGSCQVREFGSFHQSANKETHCLSVEGLLGHDDALIERVQVESLFGGSKTSLLFRGDTWLYGKIHCTSFRNGANHSSDVSLIRKSACAENKDAILSSVMCGPGTGLLLSRGCSSHVTIAFQRSCGHSKICCDVAHTFAWK